MITVVTMVNNRHDHRIGRFIDSLKAQDEPVYNIIIVDTSTGKEERDFARKACEKKAQYISWPSDYVDKARALNIGLRCVVTPFTLFTDIDIIFHPSFVARVSRLLSDSHFVLALAGYLPPAIATKDWEEMVVLARDHHEISQRMSPGACQAASTQWFKAVRGYDERFRSLGGMDVDMMVRARKAGLQVTWLDGVWALHQWHERSAAKGIDSELYDGDPLLVANQGKEWGVWRPL